jgi:hypothetical protein
LKFGNADFMRREDNRRTRKKTLEGRERINNKLNSHVTPSPGIEPGATVVIELESKSKTCYEN